MGKRGQQTTRNKLLGRIVKQVVFVCAACAGLLLAGCGQGGGGSPYGSSESPGDRGAGQGRGLAAQGGQRQRQAEFLNRLRQSDPSYQTIEKAVSNERNELGLVLNRSVPMDSIPALMRTMLTQLAAEFPGQDLTVIAYAPTQPPTRIGTANLNARTREMSYTPSVAR